MDPGIDSSSSDQAAAGASPEQGEARALGATLSLLLTPGLGPTLVGRLIETFGSAEAVLAQPGEKLSGVRGISAKSARNLRRDLKRVVDAGAAEREIDAVARGGARLLRMGGPGYPRLLSLIPDPPPVLWVRGELREDDALALGVVGSRRCTHYGREQAARFAGDAARAGLCVVSGGAYGVDAAAHEAAMRHGGRTIAVLGSGLSNPYPKEHVDLFKQIAEGRGAVVSELPLGSPPAAEHFPRRNRLISGLSLGVLVVEAAARSGALITARVAVEDHGRSAMALPGRVDALSSAGCHKLIRTGGAALVTGIADVLDELGDAGQTLKAGLEAAPEPERDVGEDTPRDAAEGDEPYLPSGPGGVAPSARDGSSGAGGSSGGGGGLDVRLAAATPTQRKLLEALDGTSRSFDELVAAAGLDPAQARTELTLLELSGAVRRDGALFARRSG
ncbi:MAG: DNA-processing protein DprA [Planctomycetota bacterium]